MSRPLLSIIIAMYNIRDYIGECIDSCANQEGVESEDYEIIVVNDGSTDDSAEVAAQHVGKHDSVTLLNKPNGGLSDARNYGFKHAKGQYVWFVDGDDLISKNSVATIIDAIKSNAQLYIIDYSELYQDLSHKEIKFSSQRLPDGIFDAHHLIASHKISFPPLMAWLQIQKRTFIEENELDFLVGAKSEDLEYSVKLFAKATEVQHIKSCLYYYRTNREGSIINVLKNDEKWISNLIRIFDSCSNYLNSHIDKNDKYTFTSLYIIIATLLYSLYSQKGEEFKLSKRTIKKRGVPVSNILLKVRYRASLFIWLIYCFMPDFIGRMLLNRR